jgi:hypothetical protein
MGCKPRPSGLVRSLAATRTGLGLRQTGFRFSSNPALLWVAFLRQKAYVQALHHLSAYTDCLPFLGCFVAAVRYSLPGYLGCRILRDAT